MRDIILVLMEGKSNLSILFPSKKFFSLGVPTNVNYKTIVNDLIHIPGVRNAHNLHIWSLSLQKNALSVHIAIGIYDFFLCELLFLFNGFR